MHILVTNDDGILAPGLHALAKSLSRIGTVTVVAPQSEQSGVGLSITYLHPILLKEHHHEGEFFGYAVGGSPADCVKLGMLELCDPKPDLVVSGINSGANVGINVLYSGTVAGAIEGAFFGATSVAVSQSLNDEPDYQRTADRAVSVIESLMSAGAEPGSLWNLNFPDASIEPPGPLKVVRMAAQRNFDEMEKRTDPRGRPYYWSGLKPIENHERRPGTDVVELTAGHATLTPLHFDLTHDPGMSKLADFSVNF